MTQDILFIYRCSYYSWKVTYMEDRFMEYTREPYGRAGKGTSVVGDCGQHSDMQSVQNLEAVINEGLRVALLEETPDQ